MDTLSLTIRKARVSFYEDDVTTDYSRRSLGEGGSRLAFYCAARCGSGR